MILALTGAAILTLAALQIQHALAHLLVHLETNTALLEHYFPHGAPSPEQLLYNPLVRQSELRADLLSSDRLMIDDQATQYVRGYRAGIAIFGLGLILLALHALG